MLVCDHHHPQSGKRLTKLPHDNTDLIVSTTHVHLTHDDCLEVIILRGPTSRLQQMAAQLKGMKGIVKGELVVARAEAQLAAILNAHLTDNLAVAVQSPPEPKPQRRKKPASCG